ncbi:hydrogen peroxide-inducible genes activator [Dongshaea marina]|uniref:hydrogen peroxide-inducible genes activator n=1 Tax=Dongshaea marina TaxID=2047966 RepID=UPI000D3EDDF5|nr:hydrogen peroxide-inducible genes activator [Dongshaea marina]
MHRWPSLKQLQYLVSLSEHRNFKRAAEACFVSQSTLSSGIQTLEELMGAQLIERDHKSFVITPMGWNAIEQARGLLSQARDLMELGRAQDEMSGRLRLGCIPTIAPFLLSRLMQKSSQLFPELELLLREDTTTNLLKLLEMGELDLLLLALPVDIGGLHSTEVGCDPFQMVVHRDWLDRYPLPDYQAMPDQSIFLLEKEHCLTEHALSACRMTDKRKINPFSATSLHTLVQMVGASLGATFLPQMAIDSGILEGTELVTVPLRQEQASRQIGLVWRPSSNRTQTFFKLGELVTELLSSERSSPDRCCELAG